MKVFVPLSDDMLDHLPADAELVPYPVGTLLLAQLENGSGEINPALNRDKAPEYRRGGCSARRPYRR
jgi:hypothetical protein